MRAPQISRPRRVNRPTPRGIALLLGGGIGSITAALFGSHTFATICLTLVVWVIAAVVIQVFSYGLELQALRSSPQPVFVGGELRILAQFRQSTAAWNVELRPPPDLGERIKLGRRSAGAVLQPRARGVYQLGTITAQRTDPFGVAMTSISWQLTEQVFVYPQLLRLPLPNFSDPTTMSGVQQASDAADDVTLREYVAGDEMRRVHWPATARQGEVMVRSEEYRATHRLNIVLDNRQLGRPIDFEAVVTAAASLATAALQNKWRVRLIYSTGGRPPHAPILTEITQSLNLIAGLVADPAENLVAVCREFCDAHPTIAFLQRLDADLHDILTGAGQTSRAVIFAAATPAEVVNVGGLRVARIADVKDLPGVWPTVAGLAR